MDTAALPTTTTSAKPLYVTSEPVPASAPPDGGLTPEMPPVVPTLPGAMSVESERTATCPQKHCWRSWIVPRPGRMAMEAMAAHPDIGLEPPVAVWQEKFGPDVKLDFPRSKGIGMLGVVLDGVVTVSASEGGKLAAMKPWSTFLAPGAGLSLTADQKGGAVVLVAYPLEGKLADRVAALRKSEKTVYWTKRPGSLVIDDLERIGPTSWSDGKAHAWFGFEKDRSPQAYLGLLMMRGDVPVVADHAHEGTWEVLFPLRAEGNLVLSGEGVESKEYLRTIPVRPGEVVLMPAGARHAFEPGGEEPLLAIQLFVPPGPEQGFRNLAEAAKK
ncbi:MAG: cupin domain-containing protein [Myxococcota bacterium]